MHYRRLTIVLFLIILPLAGPASTDKPPDAAPIRGKIALVQYNADRVLEKYEDRPMNVELIEKLWLENVTALKALAESALKQGANIIVMPEGSTYGYATPNSVWCRKGYPYLKDHRLHRYRGKLEGGLKNCLPAEKIVEPFPSLDTKKELTEAGRTTSFWTDFAIKNKVYVIYSVPEVGRNETDTSFPLEKEGEMPYYNTLGVVGPRGYVTKYRKRAVYIVDQMFAVAGRNPTIISTEFGSFGLLICLDGIDNKKFGNSVVQPGGHKYDFGLYDIYKARGITQIIVSMNWDHDPLDDTDLPEMSAENQATREKSAAGDSSSVAAMEMQARDHKVSIFVADNSKYDGTGVYIPGQKRLRTGMPQYGAGESRDGVVLVTLP